MKFEDLKPGGWYTHPHWHGPGRVWSLYAESLGNIQGCVSFDTGKGTTVFTSWRSGDALFDKLTEYDEFADAKALVEMRKDCIGVCAWSAMPHEVRQSYKSLAAKLREQGWRGTRK